MICKLVLGAFGIAYAVALLAWAAGTFGLFGSERDPLAGVFLIPLGVPWTYVAGALPDGPVRVAGALLSPLLNLGLIAAVCRLVRKS